MSSSAGYGNAIPDGLWGPEMHFVAACWRPLRIYHLSRPAIARLTLLTTGFARSGSRQVTTAGRRVAKSPHARKWPMLANTLVPISLIGYACCYSPTVNRHTSSSSAVHQIGRRVKTGFSMANYQAKTSV